MAQSSRTKGLGPGRWRFVLRPTDGSAPIEVADEEPNLWGERLDLLTVVRALESLDQPSRVTLVGCTRYVRHGIEYGLSEWRENDWKWEWFGQMVPVRDADLWQRMDRVTQYHRIECGQRRFDPAHGSELHTHLDGEISIGKWVDRIAGASWVKYSVPGAVAWCKSITKTLHRFWQNFVGIRVQGLGVRLW